MKKALMICVFVFLLSGFVLSQTAEDSDSGFYSAEMLKGDFKQVNAVVYIEIKNVKLVDKMGDGDCETNKGTGYCLYELSGIVKEVFKGNIQTKNLKFFVSPDADYPKERLIGNRVVFLNKSRIEATKRTEFVVLENSTRSIESDVLAKLRKIRKQISKKSAKTAKR